MPTKLLLLFTLFISAHGNAQVFRVSGTVTNTRMEPLAFVNVQVAELHWGTSTKEDGQFELKLEKGKYDLVITMIGYKSQKITIVVDKDYRQNIILETDDAKQMGEVVIRGRSRDYAEEIVKQVILNKEAIMAAPGAYSCDVYIKAVQQDSFRVNKKGKAVPIPDSIRAKMPDADLAGMNMAEVSIRLDHESEKRIREEKTGVRRTGQPEGLFFLSVTEGNFNFYNNLVKVPSLSETPFLSPISYSGLVAYRYKTVKIIQQGPHKIYVISVKPKQISNATVEGVITISDSSWNLLSTEFKFPKYHLPEYDFFEVKQDYTIVEGKAWMLARQEFTYFSKGGKRSRSGQTKVVYNHYQINKLFPRRHFGDEVSATAQEAYVMDSVFWDAARTEPLSQKELRLIRYRDSIYRVTSSKEYTDSIDRLTNKITWKKVSISGQTFYNREKQRTWHLPAAASLIQPFAFGGIRISPSFYYSKVSASRKYVGVWTNLSYGFRNKDINGRIQLNRLYNPFNRGYFNVSLQRDFDFIFQGDAWINMIKRSNYFLNHAAGVGHNLELVNGLYLFTDMDVAFRRSVSLYKTGDGVDSLLGDLLDNNQALAFESYNAVYGKVRLQYTPKQRYIREPKEKIILGSKWPTFYTTYRKGIPHLMKSKVDFDYLEFGIEQEVEVGLMGFSRFNIKTGSFLNRKGLRLIDYQYQRRGDPLLFQNPDQAFQALDSSFPVFKRFYQGHYVHEFNGAILNRIPFFKRIGLREVGGAGFLIAPERNLRYGELFLGVERVLKSPFDPLSKFKLGVYVVSSVANKYNNPLQFKIGITSWDKRRNKWY
jgi:hypothetical protein